MCEAPNENLERWEGQLNYNSEDIKNQPVNIKNMLLRGCTVRNTQDVIGVVVYVGNDTKIMKNLKRSPHKVSNIMRLMNNMLYSVFLFQFILICFFAALYLNWNTNNSLEHFYLYIVSYFLIINRHKMTTRGNRFSYSSSSSGWLTLTWFLLVSMSLLRY
jgi:magnesium-transporting ATPase (P-type)